MKANTLAQLDQYSHINELGFLGVFFVLKNSRLLHKEINNLLLCGHLTPFSPLVEINIYMTCNKQSPSTEDMRKGNLLYQFIITINHLKLILDCFFIFILFFLSETISLVQLFNILHWQLKSVSRNALNFTQIDLMKQFGIDWNFNGMFNQLFSPTFNYLIKNKYRYKLESTLKRPHLCI